MDALKVIADYGITTENVESRVMSELSVVELLTLATEVKSAMPAIHAQTASEFAFLADSDSAGRTGCADIACRLGRVSGLARFAALYADALYLPNYFEDYPPLAFADAINPRVELPLRTRLVGDISIALAVSPCVKAGIVRFVKTTFHFCPDCSLKLALPERRASVEEAVQQLVLEYIGRSSGKVRHVLDDQIFVNVDGPRELFPHPWVHAISKGSGEFDHYRTPKEGAPLDEAQLRAVVEGLVSQAGADIMLQNILSRSLDTHFLSARPVDFKLMSLLESVPEAGPTAVREMACQLPFLVEAPLASILSLRDKEAEAFRVTRDALKQAALDWGKLGNQTNPRVARRVYRDVLEPQLNRLDYAFDRARRGSLRSGLRDIAIGTGLLAAGAFSGFLPHQLPDLLKLTGAYKIGTDFVKAISDRLGTPDDVKRHDLYFLWRLRRANSKRRKRAKGRSQ